MPSYHNGAAVARSLSVVGTLKHAIPRARRFVQRGADPRFEVTSKEVFLFRRSFVDGTGRAISGSVQWRSTIGQISGRAVGTEFKGQGKPLDGRVRRNQAVPMNARVLADAAQRRPAQAARPRPRVAPPPPRPRVLPMPHRPLPPRPNVAVHCPPLPAASSVAAGAPEVKLGSCSICLTEHANCVWTGCGHAAACLTCAHEMKRSRPNPCCPLCRAPGHVVRVFAIA
jgi:hypothetical protein